MTQRPDDRQRERALTDLNSTLLVEASAGTGKTSLLAGRVAMLLAAGRTPSSIAAITFTERAAAELRVRVDKFASMLVNGTVPKDLEPAFRQHPLTDTQSGALSSARPALVNSRLQRSIASASPFCRATPLKPALIRAPQSWMQSRLTLLFNPYSNPGSTRGSAMVRGWMIQ